MCLNFLDFSESGFFTSDARNSLQELFDVVQADKSAQNKDVLKGLFSDINPDVVLTGWGCEGISLTDEVLDPADRLKVLGHLGSALSGLLEARRNLDRLVILNTARIIGRYVAESTLGLMIHMLRRVRHFNLMYPQTKKRGHSEQKKFEQSLYHSRVGLVGFGLVAQELIPLLQPFGCEIVVTDPFVEEDQIQAMGGNKMELDELLETSDVVSLHAASVADTHHMIDTVALAKMKDDAVLVNTARGSLVDNSALTKEIRSGRLHAAIDVLEGETDGTFKDDPLFEVSNLENLLLTPHIAGIIPDARGQMLKTLIREMHEVVTTGKKSNLVASRSAIFMET
jgi:phosphoglycerate dehydrogenase-like enzyme